MDDFDDPRVGVRRRTAKRETTQEIKAQAKKAVKVIQSIDAFPKVNEDYAQYSNVGAVVTVICTIICCALFITEVMWHRTTITKSVLSVDTQPLAKTESDAEKMKIYLDIEFPRISCSIITLDTAEASGERHLDVHDGHLTKQRLDSNGERIAPPTKDTVNKYGELKKEGVVAPAQPPRNHGQGGGLQALMLHTLMGRGNLASLFEDQFPEGIDKAFKNENNEGCEVMGYLEVNRISGQFHISPGKSLMIGGISIQLAVQTANLNLTHKIKRLAFGEGFPGAVNPLDGEMRSLPASAVMQYFLKVVPTTFDPLKGANMSTNQYSVTESMKVSNQMNGMVEGTTKTPGIYFSYELSPIRVSYRETRATLGEFLTSLCAIIGGVFSASGLVHRLIIAYTKGQGKS